MYEYRTYNRRSKSTPLITCTSTVHIIRGVNLLPVHIPVIRGVNLLPVHIIRGVNPGRW